VFDCGVRHLLALLLREVIFWVSLARDAFGQVCDALARVWMNAPARAHTRSLREMPVRFGAALQCRARRARGWYRPHSCVDSPLVSSRTNGSVDRRLPRGPPWWCHAHGRVSRACEDDEEDDDDDDGGGEDRSSPPVTGARDQTHGADVCRRVERDAARAQIRWDLIDYLMMTSPCDWFIDCDSFICVCVCVCVVFSITPGRGISVSRSVWHQAAQNHICQLIERVLEINISKFDVVEHVTGLWSAHLNALQNNFSYASGGLMYFAFWD